MRIVVFAVLLLVGFTVACDRDNQDKHGTFCTDDIPFFRFTLVGNDGKNLVKGDAAKFLPDSVTFSQVSSIYAYIGVLQYNPDGNFSISHPQGQKVDYKLRLAPTGGEARTFKVTVLFSGKCYRVVDKLTVEGGTGCTDCSPVAIIKLPY